MLNNYYYNLQKLNFSGGINIAQIQVFITLAVIRRNVLRVFGAHLRIISPAGNTSPSEKISPQWPAIDNPVSDLTGARFEPKTFCPLEANHSPL